MTVAKTLILLLALAVAPAAYAQTPSGLSPGDAFLQGYRNLTGDGAPRDATLAATFFLEAAQAGEPQAQYQLGTLFMDGTGMPKDTLWAYYWLTLANRSPSLPQAVRDQARGRLQALAPVLTTDEKRRLAVE